MRRRAPVDNKRQPGRGRRDVFLIGLLLLSDACSSNTPERQQPFRISQLGLELPRLLGWEADPSVRVDDIAKGGLLFRMIRESPVALSPRIDVVLEPARTRPTVLEDFLTQNLREMAQYEATGAIRITSVEQRPVGIGPRRGYRIQHEYTMAGGQGSSPIAITQVSTLFVLDGRGVTITAPGRTELFHPLAEQIDRIMSGIALPVPSGAGGSVKPPRDTAAAGHDTTTPPTGIQPIDLGKIGGGK